MPNIQKYHDVNKWLKERSEIVKSRGGFDDGWIDKNYMRNITKKKMFFCKWCGKPMYAAEYDKIEGSVTMSCRTSLCPGNIDKQLQFKIKPVDYDIRKMTNQYLFNSRLRF